MSDNETIGIGNLNGTLKAILLILSILAIIVPAVLGFVNLDKRQDILESTQSKHEETDAKKWDATSDMFESVHGDITSNKEHITNLEIQSAVSESRFQQIMKAIQAIEYKIDKWEPTNGK